MIPAPVILFHAIEQHQNRNRSPSKLAKEEVGGRNMVFQCRDEGRCAVYHHQAKAHEQDDREKEDPICFQSLRHELRQFCHDLFEYFAAMFKVLKLVKAGTSGGRSTMLAGWACGRAYWTAASRVPQSTVGTAPLSAS